MDQQGNIYDLNGNFVATIDTEEEDEEDGHLPSPGQQIQMSW